MEKPNSIAIIPDGNRRYAKKYKINLRKAYLKGIEKVREVSRWCIEYDVSSLTFWALSLDNLRARSSFQIKLLFYLLESEIREILNSEEFFKEKIKVHFLGKLNLLPTSLSKLMEKVQQKTKNFEKLSLNIAVAYDGREEIINATKKIASKILSGELKTNSISNKLFSKYLYIQSPPDLIIRTGARNRLSGFMPFQSAYSELFFLDRLWPEFNKRNFERAMLFFAKTQRNFGK